MCEAVYVQPGALFVEHKGLRIYHAIYTKLQKKDDW